MRDLREIELNINILFIYTEELYMYWCKIRQFEIICSTGENNRYSDSRLKIGSRKSGC